MYLSLIFVYYNIYYAFSIVSLACKNLLFKERSSIKDGFCTFGFGLFTSLLMLLYHPDPLFSFINFLLTVLLLILGKRLFKNHSYAGLSFYMANILLFTFGSAWMIGFLISLDISTVSKVLLTITAPVAFFTLPFMFLNLIEKFDVLARDVWNRPRKSYPVRSGNFQPEPFVTLQVPTYSEPPKLVIETLNKISQLDYQNYEVMVIDNNTKDEKLWMPVKKYCRQLGSKFKFYHVEGITGAKAGALNWAHKFLNPKTEIVSVIDADYQVDSNFLKALVGHFDDPKMGFVQTPHDYRDWKGNPFLTMCYWEYKAFFHTILVALNERDAAITVGTMCLIRKVALEKAGGWAEWCVTEDSELAIRIHNAGYTSVYIDETFGRGLIPETFEGYRVQRYRWIAGPVQEFRHHLKHLLGLSKEASALTLAQRLHHLNHGFNNVLVGLSLPFQAVGMLAVLSLVVHREIVQVPFVLWLTATIILFANTFLNFLVHRTVIKPSLKEYFGKVLAEKALHHTVTLSALKTLITGNAKWKRTNKFKENYSVFNALASTKEELFLGTFMAVFIVYSFILLPYHGLALMYLIGLSYVFLNYISAPVAALISTYVLNKGHIFDLKGMFSFIHGRAKVISSVSD